MINAKVLPTSINNDDSARFLQDGEVFNIENMRIGTTADGKNYSVKNIPSTIPILNNLPGGDNLCVGTAVDLSKQRVIWLNSNSNKQDGIYVFDLFLNKTFIVLLSNQTASGLNFRRDYRYDRNLRVVGTLLLGTDNNNEPFCVDIEAGIKLNQPAYVSPVTYTTPVLYTDITLIKRPPIFPIIVSKGNDVSYAGNTVGTQSQQFTYQYVYKNGQESALASFSQNVRIDYVGESKNFIFGQVPITEKISDYVQKINFLVRHGSTGLTEIFKVLDKNRSADALAIQNHNTISAPLYFNYYGNVTGFSLDIISANTFFDNIPLLAETIEFAINRLLLANILVGYNAPLLTSLSLNVFQGTVNYDNRPTLKVASSRQGGVVFFDRFKRPCGVVTSDTIVVVTPERTYSDSVSSPAFKNGVEWLLSNANALVEIPEWAYYYTIVLSKDKTASFFLEGHSSKAYYVTKDNVSGEYLYTQTSFASGQYGIGIDISEIIAFGRGYVYNEGDIIKVYKSDNSAPYSLSVLGQDGNYILCSAINLGTLGAIDLLFSIFTPYKQDITGQFYETGNIYSITNPGLTTRMYSVLTARIFGNVYLDFRGKSGTITYQDMSYNDVAWQVWDQNLGVVRALDSIGQKRLSTTVRWTDTIINNTQANGLNKIGVFNSKDIGASTGEIQKIQLANKQQEDGNILLIITQETSLSAYLGERILQSSTGSTAGVATTDEIIGTINEHQSGRGTINPESVIEYNGNIWWWDGIHGKIAQYSQNGVVPVSDFKISQFFDRFAKIYKELSMNRYNTPVHSAYDVSVDEVHFSMPALKLLPQGTSTIGSYAPVVPCIAVTVNTITLPDAESGTLYSADISFSGTQPFTISNANGGAWMTFSSTANGVHLGGTPTDSNVTNNQSVVFDVSNCGGTVHFSQSISVKAKPNGSHFVNTNQDTGDATFYQQIFSIAGVPNETIVVSVTTLNSASGPAILHFNGIMVTDLNQTFTVTLNSMGISSNIPIRIDPANPYPGHSYGANVTYTITSASGGNIGNPNSVSQNKAYS